MSTPAGDRFPYRLLLLSGAAFVSVSSEFLPTAVLPEIAHELRVSESQVGLLITLFAGVVVLSTTPLTIVTRHFSRKWLLVGLLGVFALANLFAAAAPTFEALAAARVLGGLAHGLFWAVASPYAALLVPRRQLARAISVVTAGGTLAFVLGVPAGAAIGLAVGWRLAFVTMAAATVVFLCLSAWLLPSVRHRFPPVTGEIRLPLRRDRSLVALVIVATTAVLMALGHNILYTYIAPWSLAIGGVGETSLSLVLFCYGAAGSIGLVAAGAFGDRYPRLVVNLMMAAMMVALAGLAIFGHSPLPVIAFMILWSAGFAGLPAILQTRTLHAASARLRDLSGAINGTAFNVAIGGGALVGGFLLDGFGLGALPWFACVIVALALTWTMATDRARIRAHPAEGHLG